MVLYSRVNCSHISMLSQSVYRCAICYIPACLQLYLPSSGPFLQATSDQISCRPVAMKCVKSLGSFDGRYEFQELLESRTMSNGGLLVVLRFG